MSAERTFAAFLVIDRSPWDVYELLADEGQQSAWRDRFSVGAHILDAQPYTRIRYSDNLTFEVEPEGSGTRLRASRTYVADGLFGRLGLRMHSRSAAQAELSALLLRVESALLYDGV